MAWRSEMFIGDSMLRAYHYFEYWRMLAACREDCRLDSSCRGGPPEDTCVQPEPNGGPLPADPALDGAGLGVVPRVWLGEEKPTQCPGRGLASPARRLPRTPVQTPLSWRALGGVGKACVGGSRRIGSTELGFGPVCRLRCRGEAISTNVLDSVGVCGRVWPCL